MIDELGFWLHFQTNNFYGQTFSHMHMYPKYLTDLAQSKAGIYLKAIQNTHFTEGVCRKSVLLIFMLLSIFNIQVSTAQENISHRLIVA